MTTLNKRAPKNLPRAVSDLVAEGGNVLASDDVPIGEREVAYVAKRRLHLSKTGRWIARVPKS